MAIRVRCPGPASEAAIRRTEEALGVGIPGSYRRFLQASDGGRPIETAFSDAVGIDWFLGTSGIVETCALVGERLPEHLVPIAQAPGGDLICVSAAPDEQGVIYLWVHDRERDGENVVERVAGSFEEFVSGLREPRPDEMLPRVEPLSVWIDPDFLRWAKEQEELEDRLPILRWPPEKAV